MGLFINNREHPEVFKNKQNINEPNQAYSRKDYFTELINELRMQSQLHKETEAIHWKQVDNQLHDLRENHQYQKEFENQIIQYLQTINDKQLELQKELAGKLAEQAEFQGGVLQRLDTQEALIDKLSRQLNNIRSILFERTNYLAGKIEDGYKVTSSYVYKLMTGSEKPLTFFLLNNKKEEGQKQSDQQ
ncbi:hypothetical protein ACIFOT_15305 [Neobacillus sp. NRS-1170]|uniref:hypothetical protein n=1 Tax=Neobacillus sp. NRS-1170 TaxID=3233898 RepID=UPI003D2ADD18